MRHVEHTMQFFLAAIVFFAILTLWVPAYWPVTVFQAGIFSLAIAILFRESLQHPSRRTSDTSAEADSTERWRQYAGFYPFLPLSLAVLWGLFQWSTGHTAYAFETETAIVRWATFLAVFLIGVSLFREPEVSRWFRSAMLWFGFVIAVLATVQTFTSDGDVFWLFPSGHAGHIMGPIIYRNHYAAFMEAVLPIALYEALQRRKNSLVYSGIAAVMYASVIASASRSGTVLTTAEVVVAAALMWRRDRMSGRAVALALLRMTLLFSAFTAVVGWERVWNRFWEADPMQVRNELNISSLHMIAAHPWLGTGLGTWPTVYPHYAVIDIGVFANQAHNDWLQWTVEGGIPFCILIATLFLWCLRPATRTIWGLGIISVFLHALVDYPFSRPALGSWPILILAMLATDRLASEKRTPPRSKFFVVRTTIDLRKRPTVSR